jgi:hypothetical protein
MGGIGNGTPLPVVFLTKSGLVTSVTESSFQSPNYQTGAAGGGGIAPALHA